MGKKIGDGTTKEVPLGAVMVYSGGQYGDIRIKTPTGCIGEGPGVFKTKKAVREENMTDEEFRIEEQRVADQNMRRNSQCSPGGRRLIGVYVKIVD